MRRPAFLAALTFVALALAGCSGGDGDGPSASPSASGTPSATGSASPSATGTATSSGTTSTGPAPQNRAPTGTASALVNGTAVTFTLNGTDPDGDALTWTLAFGDGAEEEGAALPATVDHTYAAGNHTANFTVSDGEASKSYEVVVAIAAAAGGGQSVTFTGSITAPDPFAVADGLCVLPLADVSGSGTWGDIHGLPSEVEPDWAFQATPDSVVATFIDSAGNVGGSGNSGTVGDGMTQAMVCGTAPMVDYTLVLTPPA